MEFIMQKTRFLPMTLIAVAILAGCSSVPQNSSLTDAHNRYNSAFSNPQVASLAALELKDAGDSLSKADEALNKGESTATVNHLSYIAYQKVAIAQETAKRKAAELAVADASTKRDKMRLEARTAEADTARQQTAIAQETVDQQAAALAAASAKSQSDQALIAQQEMQLKDLNAKKTARGLVITLGDVLFSSNKAELKSGGMRNMQKLADFLNKYPQHKVLIEGYTDSVGSDSLNQKLSERRAMSVKSALIGMGISSDRISTQGYGEAFPVAGNDTASSRQLNRRVEIILSDENGNIAPR
jgi:outer membrane protein OmpA-like peptidoglycan-associated protein